MCITDTTTKRPHKYPFSHLFSFFFFFFQMFFTVRFLHHLVWMSSRHAKKKRGFSWGSLGNTCPQLSQLVKPLWTDIQPIRVELGHVSWSPFKKTNNKCRRGMIHETFPNNPYTQGKANTPVLQLMLLLFHSESRNTKSYLLRSCFFSLEQVRHSSRSLRMLTSRMKWASSSWTQQAIS